MVREKTLKGIKDALNYKNQKLIVVAAGVPSANIKEWLDKDGITPTFFLVMPNIAIAYKQSMTFITPVDASATEIQQITEIFDELGESLIMEERLFPAATAMSCAIALRHALCKSQCGRRRRDGLQGKGCPEDCLAPDRQGAVELLQETGEHPEAAIDKGYHSRRLHHH